MNNSDLVDLVLHRVECLALQDQAINEGQNIAPEIDLDRFSRSGIYFIDTLEARVGDD
jgi:hypothetical protein